MPLSRSELYRRNLAKRLANPTAARTCNRCLISRTNADFYAVDTTCKKCVLEARKTKYETVKSTPEYISYLRDYNRKKWLRSPKYVDEHFQSETVPAPRWGEQYSSFELELIADRKRSLKDLALMLGRTYYAVAQVRSLIRNDPEWIRRFNGSKD